MAPFYPLAPAALSGLRRHDGGPPDGAGRVTGPTHGAALARGTAQRRGRVRVRDTTSWRHPARAYLPEVDR